MGFMDEMMFEETYLRLKDENVLSQDLELDKQYDPSLVEKLNMKFHD